MSGDQVSAHDVCTTHDQPSVMGNWEPGGELLTALNDRFPEVDVTRQAQVFVVKHRHSLKQLRSWDWGLWGYIASQADLANKRQPPDNQPPLF